MLWDGPFNVLRHTNKYYEVDIKGKPTNISIDQLKPTSVAVKDDTQHDHSYSMEIETEEKKYRSVRFKIS